MCVYHHVALSPPSVQWRRVWLFTTSPLPLVTTGGQAAGRGAFRGLEVWHHRVQKIYIFRCLHESTHQLIRCFVKMQWILYSCKWPPVFASSLNCERTSASITFSTMLTRCSRRLSLHPEHVLFFFFSCVIIHGTLLHRDPGWKKRK